MTAFLLTQIIGYSFNVTFQVDMNNVTQGFTTPEVNGGFNGWCGGCAPMSDANGDNIWDITIDLPAGNHEFKFAADSWSIQENLTPGSSCTLTTGAFTNRLITVSGDMTLDVVCWGSCLSCGLAPSSYDVTFRVDMNNVTEAYTTPEVNGTFNNWCGGCAPMTDANADGVWEITIALEPGTYEYKYAADTWTIQENLPAGSACTITTGAFTNRLLVVSANETLPVVCWGSCEDCGQSTGPFNVTFKVDMSLVTETYTTPEVNGTFNNWCGGCAPMSDLDGDDVWELTISLPVGAHEYKFAYDAWAGQEELTAGTSCVVTLDGFTNRYLVVEDNAVLDAVCWASCEICDIAVNELNGASFGIYPNPASENITLSLEGLSFNASTVKITNAIGQTVHFETLLNNNQKSISKERFENGVYFIALSNGDVTTTQRFIVQH
jgi:Secretion system C-terminal sorting domain/Glycogen recognition site of AMP-activated protein kinase